MASNKNSLKFSLTNDYIKETKMNLETPVIITTKDKLENILLKHYEKLKLKTAWKTPFSIFISLLAAILTADFKDFLGLSTAFWQALFVLGCLLACGYFIVFLYKSKNKKVSIESLISEISGGEAVNEVQKDTEGVV